MRLDHHFTRTASPVSTHLGAVAVLTSLLTIIGCSKAPSVDAATPKLGTSRAAVFVNGDFETGDFTGWTKGTGRNVGIIYPPANEGNLQIQAGGTDKTFVVTGTAESVIPAGMSAGSTLRVPRYGSHAAVVNQLGASNNLNTLTQQFTAGASDVDPSDGKVHVRFALAPVLNNGGHAASQQPYFWVTLMNITKGTQLFNTFNYSNQAGVPWKIDPANSTIGYTDWQSFDISPGNVALAVGDTVQLRVIAAGCAAGGHWGEIYVDGFGAFLPGLSVSASAPQSANAGSDITYTFSYGNRGTGAATNATVAFTLPTGVTYQSLSAPGASCTAPSVGATGVVTCNVGTVNPAATGSFTVTVNINSGATGKVSAGNYTISGDGISALIGPLVETTITSGVQYADLTAAISDPLAAVGWGQAHAFSFTIGNLGPATATGATVSWAMPAQYASASWTCAASAGASCPAASGSGTIADTVTLPSGESLTYSVSGTIIAGTGTGSVSNLVTVSPPSGVQDNNSGNSQAIHTNSIGTLRTITLVKAGSGSGRVVSSPSAIDCAGGCPSQAVTFIDGMSVSLTATANTGDSFSGWSGACSGFGNPCNFTVSGDATVTATFDAPQQTVTVSPTTNGTIVCDSPVARGASSTCVITPAPGYRLATITDNSVDVFSLVSGGQYVISNLQANHTVAGTFVFACGNGIIEAGEGCDDGNTTPGDGCSALCAIEPGFSCPIAGAACSAQCGDGVQTAGEGCDDGNTFAGDGCSSTCTIESGFLCSNTSANLVTNGGFDQGNTGFTSMLSYLPGGPNTAANQYGISTGNSWRSDVCAGVPDGERSAANQSMYFNAGSDPNQVIYQTDVTVVAGHDYIVEARAMSWTPAAPPRMVISLGSVNLTNEFTAVLCSPTVPWTRISATYHAPTSGTITLKVFDHETAAGGNDGALDAFSVREAQATTCGRPAFDTLAVITGANATAFPLSGTCLSGGNVTVSTGAISTTVPCTAGTWSATLDVSGLSDGPVTFGIVQSNSSGTASNSASTVKDTFVPAPVIQDPVDGWLTNEQRPTFTGTCKTNSMVSITDGATRVCSATCVGGAFSCRASSALDEGTHSVVASQTDEWGNGSLGSTAVTFSIDITAPLAPTITSPARNAQFSNPAPSISGGCEADAKVSISEASTLLCTAVCDSTGHYSCQSTTLSEGAHTISATQVDQAGNQSGSKSTTFTVDFTEPNEPLIVAPVNGAITNNPMPLVSGACEPGAHVAVFEFATQLCAATCSSGGSFTCQLAARADGSHSIVATQTDAAGNTSAASPVVTFTIDTAAPAAPAIGWPTPGLVTKINSPVVTGTCEPFNQVTLYEFGSPRCSTSCEPGGTFSCQLPTLADGAHIVVAQQVDLAGNLGPASAGVPFFVDTVANAPVLTSPASGAFLSTLTPTISGSCEQGAIVTVTEAGQVLCTANCFETHFSCTSDPLAEGAHTLSATQLDPAGNQSAPSNAISLTLDITAPAAPTVAHPASGDFVRAQQVTFSGTCETPDDVEVLEGSTVVCATSCSGGTYTCETTPLPEGAHDFTVRQQDQAGNMSPNSPVISITFDVTAPEAPAFTNAPNATVADNTPHLTGTCEPFAAVRVEEAGALRCTDTCSASGTFACDSSALADGTHTVTVKQTDRAGNESGSSTLTFSVDTTSPLMPTLSAPIANSTVTTQSPAFKGAGEPGSTTVVFVDGIEVCRAVAASDGLWACSPGSALADGHHLVQLVGHDVLDNTTGISNGVGFTIDTSAPHAPSLLVPSADQRVGAWPTFSGRGDPSSTITVKVDGTLQCTALVDAAGNWACLGDVALPTGAHTAVVLATDTAGNVSPSTSPTAFTVVGSAAPGAPVITSPAEASATTNHTPQVLGRAEPGAKVSVSIDGAVVCSVDATDEQGHFACFSSVSIPDGAHGVFAVASNVTGLGQKSETVHFTVDTLAPAAPLLVTPASGSTVSPWPLYSGSAEANTQVTVTVDGSVGCTQKADLHGRFTCFATSALAAGPHAASVTAKDRAGNQSPESVATAFTVDPSAPPAAPSIRSPFEGAVLAVQVIAVDGKAEPGSHVHVLLDGDAGCDAIASLAGDWACTITPVIDGLHAITAQATTIAGTSGASVGVTVTVDTAAPQAPVISAPIDHVTVTLSPAYTGTAEAAATVHVFVDGRERCSTTASEVGAFSCSALTPLTEGEHEVYAIATDAAGHDSPASTSQTFVASAQTPSLDSPTDGALLASSTPTFTGHAQANIKVRVTADGTAVCESAADGSGAWACTSTVKLSDGLHHSRVTSDNGYGTIKVSTEKAYTIDTIAPAAPVLVSPANGEANILGSTIAFSGTAEPGATVQVKVDGVVVCSAQVDASGGWMCTATNLDGARHEVIATATDKAGNASNPSTASIFSNTTKLAQPSVSSPAAGSTVQAPNITFSGQGTPGTAVSVTDESGRTVCTAMVDASGTWSCTGTESAGQHSFTTTLTWNGASSSSDAVSVTIVEDVRFAGGLGCSTTRDGNLTLTALALLAMVLRRRQIR